MSLLTVKDLRSALEGLADDLPIWLDADHDYAGRAEVGAGSWGNGPDALIIEGTSETPASRG